MPLVPRMLVELVALVGAVVLATVVLHVPAVTDGVVRTLAVSVVPLVLLVFVGVGAHVGVLVLVAAVLHDPVVPDDVVLTVEVAVSIVPAIPTSMG